MTSIYLHYWVTTQSLSLLLTLGCLPKERSLLLIPKTDQQGCVIWEKLRPVNAEGQQ